MSTLADEYLALLDRLDADVGAALEAYPVGSADHGLLTIVLKQADLMRKAIETDPAGVAASSMKEVEELRAMIDRLVAKAAADKAITQKGAHA